MRFKKQKLILSVRAIAMAFACLAMTTTGLTQTEASVLRDWNEVMLNAIRNDLARPNVHARNLYHFTEGIYHLQLSTEGATAEAMNSEVAMWPEDDDALLAIQNDEINFDHAVAAYGYRFIQLRYAQSPGWAFTLSNLVTAFISSTSSTPNVLLNSSPAAAWGWACAEAINTAYQFDGANQDGDYDNTCYEPVNEPLDVTVEASCTEPVEFPNRWQPLSFGGAFEDQSGNQTFEDVVPFSGANWGNVTPFALDPAEAMYAERDGCTYPVYLDPGPPLLLGEDSDTQYEWQTGFAHVAVWQNHLNTNDGVIVDISPGACGNINAYPANPDYLYGIEDGGDFGTGHALNPVTGIPYPAQNVLRGDYTRVLAEFWADGPESETPPGHWFTILNGITDHPDFNWKWEGKGEPLPPNAYLARAYRLLGGTMHDAAIAAWSVKGYYDFVRPITAIRYMLSKGQSSQTDSPSYDPEGVPLIEGVFELVQEGDPILETEPEALGTVKTHRWLAGDEGSDGEFGWTTGCAWRPFQMPTFVTPPFAGYVSGHSTYSRAAADALSFATGSRYFPGGVGVFEVEAETFLAFESGPSEAFELQWATYQDAADQCALSRIWGGIHPPMDDIRGREMGEQVAELAIAQFQEELEGIFTPVLCPEDIDGNGNVGTNDLLSLLSKYGEDCE
jgi:hypothetical protein